MIEEYRSVGLRAGPGPGRLYRLEVEISPDDLADLREPLRLIDSDVVSGLIDKGNSDGYEWVVFFESAHRDQIHPQFAYCGRGNLEPVALE